MGTERSDVSRYEEEVSGNRTKRRPPPAIRFEELSQGESEVVIEFQNQQYRLRVTKNGKLILNK